MAKSYLNQAGLARGLRNNNPGNLVRSANNWQGKVPYSQSKDSHFEQFFELRYGIRAMMLDIYADYNKGKNTVTKLISEYAPSFENNTGAYIATVANMVGVAATAAIPALTKEVLIGFAKAIVYVENGAAFNGYVTADDYEQAYALTGKNLPSIKKK